MSKKGKVITQGFLTDVDAPSEERLAAHVDLTGLAGYRHVDWVSALQDLLREVDVNYRAEKGERKGEGKEKDGEKPRRGRSVRVRYVKDEQGQQRKVATFHPYPSLLVNHLKELRRKVYDVLNENCLILQEERVGRMKRKLYFLPASLAAEAMLRIEELNHQLEGLKDDVGEFEESPDFEVVMGHIKEAGFELNGFHADLSTIRVSPVPLSLSREFFEQYLEEERRKALADVDEERRRGLSALEREIERQRREMLEAIRRDLQGRFATTITLAEEAVKSALKGGRLRRSAGKRFKTLSELIEGAGVGYDERPFKALGDVFSAAGLRNNEALTKAVGELAESLGLKPTGEPARDMELAAKTVRGESVMLFTID